PCFFDVQYYICKIGPRYAGFGGTGQRKVKERIPAAVSSISIVSSEFAAISTSCDDRCSNASALTRINMVKSIDEDTGHVYISVHQGVSSVLVIIYPKQLLIFALELGS